MKWLRWLVFTVLTVGLVSDSTAQTAPPYIYYFSDILHAFVIERADGTDSRVIGEGIIPKNHNAIENAVWSPSGRWFAFSSFHESSHSRTPRQANVISTDGKIAIPFEEGWMSWSPVNDLLLHVTYNNDSARVRLYDFDNYQKIFDQPIKGGPCYYCYGTQWNPDGSQVAIRPDYFNFYNARIYNLLIADLSLSERNFPKAIQNQSPLIVSVNEQNQLSFHHIFTDQEWTFDFVTMDDSANLRLHWNPQYTQAIIQITKPRDPTPDSPNSYKYEADYFWVSLESVEGRLGSIGEGWTTKPAFEGLVWSSRGDKVIFETPDALIVLSTPSLQLVTIPIQSTYHAWESETHILARTTSNISSGKFSGELFRIDVRTGDIQQIENSGSSNIWISPDGKYLQDRDEIYDLSTMDVIARSRMSGDPMGGYEEAIWNVDTDWVLMRKRYYRSHHFEVIKLDDARTRELTTCLMDSCAGWMPAGAADVIPQNGSLASVVPSPVKSLFLDATFQRIAFSPDGTEIDVISTFGEDEPAKRTRWNVETAEMLEETEIPYCTGAGCTLAWDIDFFMSFAGRTQLTNAAQTYRLNFDENARIYSVVNVRTNDALYAWDVANSSWYVEHFSWVGNTLFIATNANSGICLRYWHPPAELRTLAIPFICEFSPNLDYALLIPQFHGERTVLLDVNSGEMFPVNFYAHDGAFSPDGKQIVLGRNSIVTFWNVSDIVGAAR